jgi:hypothetical protein
MRGGSHQSFGGEFSFSQIRDMTRCYGYSTMDNTMESKAISGNSTTSSGITSPKDISSALCGYCYKFAQLGCSVCKEVRYCDKKCQTAHWPKHKSRCIKK